MAKVKAAAKTTPVKKMRASTEVQSDSDFEDSNVENGAAVVAEPETPKSKPKAKAKPKGPANGVQKAKNTTPKPKAKAAKAATDGAKPKAKAKPKGPSTAEMVGNALSTLKDRKGIAMAAIRNFIVNNYQRKVDNKLLYNMKKYMENEFLADRLRMTNSDRKTIDFSKRFALMK